MDSTTLKKKLGQVVEDLYKAIHAKCNELRGKGIGHEEHNDAFGKVHLIEFDPSDRMWLDAHKWIVGIGVKGNELYAHILKVHDCDYLHPFDETKELTPYRLTEVLKQLESM